MGQLTKDEVFALAVQRYSDTVFRAAMHNCSCTADAEDVVQDVFEKLLRYEGRFESEEHLKAWLLRVAINRCRDITRAARQKDTELNENIPAPESGNDGSVLDAVRTLPENYRNAVYLHYYEGYTAAEVGRMLGAPTNTVLSWLLRVAINRCRDITRAARQKDTELNENIPAPESGNDGSVLDAVRTLPENYRNAVYLHYYEGYTAAEVGRMLGAPTNTVLSWLRRARAQLHTLLKEEIEDEVV